MAFAEVPSEPVANRQALSSEGIPPSPSAGLRSSAVLVAMVSARLLGHDAIRCTVRPVETDPRPPEAAGGAAPGRGRVAAHLTADLSLVWVDRGRVHERNDVVVDAPGGRRGKACRQVEDDRAVRTHLAPRDRPTLGVDEDDLLVLVV